MYNLKEDLFERDEDDSQDYADAIQSPGSKQLGSPGLSFSTVNAPAVFAEEDDDIYFPSYDNDKRDGKNEGDDQGQSVESGPGAGPRFHRLVSSGTIERSEDDSAACVKPSQHVDYLSYDWNEEDIWSSWKLLMSKRKVYPNSERLENASWRTWEKKRRNLKTISPETVRWLKDHDVTWLYGPLQPSFCTLDRKFNTNASCPVSDFHSSCKNKKPILKKRSLSELMFRRSISSASLLKQAATTAEAQRSRKQAASLYNSFIFNTPGLRRANTTALGSLDASSNASSDIDHESWNSKNVRFHELVEQCIALAHEPDYHYVSDSDDEVVVMRKPLKQQKKSVSKQKLPTMKPKKKGSVSKTIEKLPHATLKYPLEVNQDEIAESSELGLGISPRPNTQTAQDELLFGISSPNEADDEEVTWSPPPWLRNRKDSVQIFAAKLSANSPTTAGGLSRDSSFLHRPLLERRNDATESALSIAKPVPINGHDAAITFELPPCRSQLNAFSFRGNGNGFTKTPHVVSPDEDEEWAENIDISPSHASDYFTPPSNSNSNSPSDSTLDENSDSETSPQLQGADARGREEKFNASPRASHDSGYESHSPDMWRVRDTSALQAEKEREKGLVDWDLYQDPDAWDEVSEAVAWQRGF